MLHGMPRAAFRFFGGSLCVCVCVCVCVSFQGILSKQKNLTCPLLHNDFKRQVTCISLMFIIEEAAATSAFQQGKEEQSGSHKGHQNQTHVIIYSWSS